MKIGQTVKRVMNKQLYVLVKSNKQEGAKNGQRCLHVHEKAMSFSIMLLMSTSLSDTLVVILSTV